MVARFKWAAAFCTGVALMLLAVCVSAECTSMQGTNYSRGLNIVPEAMAAGPVASDGAETHARATPLSVPTGAWLISIGLIGFVVSRRRFRKKDD